MDLAYYESPPGIQLLNCMAFPSTVKGGESTFLDTFVLAELLRERDPESFATLLRVPATFQKSHADRCGQRLRTPFLEPVLYQKPIIFAKTGSGQI
jgi:alpha-ketoglutarate-dependent taurine dioxygenase